MEIGDTVKSTVAKITGDKTLLAKFKKNPTDTVKSVVGDKVSMDVVNKIVEGVKAKIGGEGILAKIKAIFKKK